MLSYLLSLCLAAGDLWRGPQSVHFHLSLPHLPSQTHYLPLQIVIIIILCYLTFSLSASLLVTCGEARSLSTSISLCRTCRLRPTTFLSRSLLLLSYAILPSLSLPRCWWLVARPAVCPLPSLSAAPAVSDPLPSSPDRYYYYPMLSYLLSLCLAAGDLWRGPQSVHFHLSLPHLPSQTHYLPLQIVIIIILCYLTFSLSASLLVTCGEARSLSTSISLCRTSRLRPTTFLSRSFILSEVAACSRAVWARSVASWLCSPGESVLRVLCNSIT